MRLDVEELGKFPAKRNLSLSKITHSPDNHFDNTLAETSIAIPRCGQAGNMAGAHISGHPCRRSILTNTMKYEQRPTLFAESVSAKRESRFAEIKNGRFIL